MHTILQYLYSASKHIEIYLKAKPKLLLAGVILFGFLWSIIAPDTGLAQLALNSLNQDKLTELAGKEETLSELSKKTPLGLQAAELTANSSAIFGSSAILAAQIEPNGESFGSEETEESSLVILGESALLSSFAPAAFISQEPRTGIITYIVQSGDTPSSIADFFGISVETALWANNLKENSIIRPGDKLTILPVDSVLHKVKSGQTIDWLAKYYKADIEEIMAYNDLPADGQIDVGQELIIPGGEMPVPVSTPKPKRIVRESYSGPGTGKSQKFPYGQCTYYVAQKRYVPWRGNAKDWINNAEAMGYSVCRGNSCEPQPGAIISLRGDSWLIRLYGHVAYLEAVNGDWITFSEMNYAGWGVRSVRTINKNSSLIKGYIY